MAFVTPKPRRGKHIADPDELVQGSMFAVPHPIDVFPRVLRTVADYNGVLKRALDGGYDVGLDLETTLKGDPTILGIGYYDPETNGEAVSIPWNDALARHTIHAVREAGRRLVAHSALGADRPWVERKLRIKTRVEDWWCSMLSHYAANMHLTKMAQKDEDEDDGGSLGLMNLWSALRCLPLPLWNYKECRGAHGCTGPCPTHTVFEYNGVDAWASPTLQHYHKQTFTEMQVPDSFIQHLHEMSAICYAMQRRGVRIDRDFLDVFDASWREKVAAIEKQLPFNPRSEPAIRAFFEGLQAKLGADAKYELADTRKETLQDLLDDLAPETPGYQELEKLFLLKSAGKGSKSWFDNKYFTPFSDLSEEEKASRYDGTGKDRRYTYTHARWNNTGTATLRLACSKPNLMNIPSKGDLSRLRKAVKPRDGYQIAKADAKQLEVRIAVYDGGDDPSKVIKLDFFTDLVEKSNGKFAEVAAKKTAALPPGSKPVTARDMAKATGHAATNGEGMELKSEKELLSPRYQKLIDMGAIRVFWDWRFGDKVVCFSGINLSQRLFGNYTDENRALANSLLFDTYYQIVPWIIPWQQKVSREVYELGYCRGLDGSFLRLDSPILKENFKAAFSKRTQGGGAFFMQSKMREDYRRTGEVWMMQVHDEMVKEVPEEWSPAEIRDDCAFLETPCLDLPGRPLIIPFECKYGPAWGGLKLLD